MRVTIRIEDRLHAVAKARAARSGMTLGELVEQALRESLARHDDGGSRHALPVFRGGRLIPDVSLDDGSALLDLMDTARR